MSIISKFQSLEKKRYFFSLIASLFILAAIPVTVYLVQNARQLQTPAAISANCGVVSAENFGNLPNVSKAENFAKNSSTVTRRLKAETFKIFKNNSTIINLARNRKALLLKTMKTCPNEALKQTLSSKEREAFAKIAPNEVESDVTIVGSLEIRHNDFFANKTSDYSYLLTTKDNQKINLHPAGGFGELVESRTVIRVRGVLLENEMVFDASKKLGDAKNLSGGFDIVSQPGNPPVLGYRPHAVIEVRFRNSDGSNAINKDEINRKIREASDYYKESSYGKVNDAALAFGIYTIDMDTVCIPTTELINKAIAAADNEINYSIITDVTIVYEGNCQNGQGTLGRVSYPTNEGTATFSLQQITSSLQSSTQAFAHELGHAYTLGHANFWVCPSDIDIRGNADGVLNRQNNCNKDYYDTASTMNAVGLPLGSINGAQRESLGWLNPGNLQQVSSSGNYIITPIENNDPTLKVLKIPHINSFDPNSTANYLYLEYRQPLGFDQNLSPEQTQGVWIRMLGVYQGTRTHVLKANSKNLGVVNNLGLPYEDYEWFDPTLKLGETFTDKMTNTRITLTALNSEGAMLSINLNGIDSPTATAPDQTNSEVSWNQPVGLLTVAGQAKLVDFNDIKYSVDFKCVSGPYCTNEWNQWTNCSTWPTGNCPAFLTSGTSVNVPVQQDASYKYRVWLIVPNPGGDPRFPVKSVRWVGETDVDVCGSGVCTKTLSWNPVNYGVFLQRNDNGKPACGAADYNTVLGCTDYISTTGPTEISFRGVPIDTDFKFSVITWDADNQLQGLQNSDNYGKSLIYSRTCTGSLTCTLGNETFKPNEPVVYTVKVNDANGAVLDSSFLARADGNGAFTRSWNWGYEATMFTTSSGSCASGCQSSGQLTTNTKSSKYVIGALKAGTSYKQEVCVPKCRIENSDGSVSQGTIIVNRTITTTTPVKPMIKAPTFTCDSSGVKVNLSWNKASNALLTGTEQVNIYTSDGRLWTSSTSTNGTYAIPSYLPPNTSLRLSVNSFMLGDNWWPTLNYTSSNLAFTSPSCELQNIVVLGISADYFDNINFTNKKLSRKENAIDFYWGKGSPDPSIGPDTFSAIYTQAYSFEKGVYRFTGLADGTIKVFLDGASTPIINQIKASTLASTVLNMGAGLHTIKVEFTEYTGDANIRFKFTKQSCSDINGDGNINSLDLLLISRNYGKIGLTSWDINGDNIVNSLDLQRASQNYGKTCQ